MGKTFRSWDPEQRLLLPPAVHEFVPSGHLAHFVRDLVREQLDLSAIVDTYTEERGYPPYDPVMMTALLLCAAAVRVRAGALRLAPDRPGLRGAGRLPGGHGHESPRLPDDQRFCPAAPDGAEGPVRAR